MTWFRMAHRGAEAKIVFDFDDPMGDSTWSPAANAFRPAQPCLASGHGRCTAAFDRTESWIDLSLLRGRCQLTYNIKNDKLLHVEGRDGPANHNRLCVKAALASITCITGPPAKPLIRKEGIAKDADAKFDPSDPLKYFREATDEALDFAANGLKKVIRETEGSGLAGFGSRRVRMKRLICSRNLSAPALRRTMWITAHVCATPRRGRAYETVNERFRTVQ